MGMEPNRRCQCGSDRIVPWREMVDVAEKLAPGGEIPLGECEICGAFLYVEDLRRQFRNDEVVRECQWRYRTIGL